MRSMRLVLCLLLLACCAPRTLSAALPAETREQISDIRKGLSGISKLLRAKEYGEVEQIINDAAEKLDEIARNAGPEDANDRNLLSAQKYLFDQQARLLSAKGVSFASDVAPIFNDKCMRCHSDNPRGGLDLSSFAALRRGGQSGPLLVPGNPNRSLVLARLTAADDQQRMPRGGQALEPKELLIVSTWIKSGAKFDGDDESAMLADVIRAARQGTPEKVDIAMATGKETVSFTNDIAPFMTRLCLGCHSGNNPRGGLSLETFERMMQGGDSGRVIIAGNLEGSRLFRLVGGLENPRMPQGQARITRKNYEDLKTWFEEGNKFDGDSPRTPLRQLIPSPDEMKAAELAKLTPEQWQERRLERTKEQWDRTLPKDPGSRVEAKEFLVWGNVSGARLEEIARMADKSLDALKGMFDDKSKDLTFNGRLAVLVFKDRLGYEEFNITVENRRAERSMIGHSKVTPAQEDAYIVLEDVGDDPEQGQMDLETSLTTQLTSAYLQKEGGRLPGWIVNGTGLYLASRSGGRDYFGQLPKTAAEAVAGVQRPEDIFADGAFSPAQTDAVGYTLVAFMINSGGGAGKFGQFISRLRNGSTVDAAAQAVYRANARALALGYAGTLPKP